MVGYFFKVEIQSERVCPGLETLIDSFGTLAQGDNLSQNWTIIFRFLLTKKKQHFLAASLTYGL